ncbi:hypothetical protein [Neptunomonas antarctica]|uniref:Uncharacterized protein n=1 Tax=Neptunomonas antarctica TaxID=619304 RepID=A0A1N7MQA0_9GAMM|nr:hypothetical protein [Neptunomonas antarctica]SIS88287.1 hypothetical protein SAMN05421760_106265 [Neptunomonas antarctica]
MIEYYIIDLTRSNIRKGLTVFMAKDLKTRTPFLEEAGRVPEAIVNANLERFDNGQTTRAMLTNAIQTSSRRIVPLENLNISQLLYTPDALIKRQAL